MRSGESGLTLIETLMALTIFGLVGVIFMGGMGTTLIATMVSQERVTSESLAKSQMEYVKNDTYDDVNDPPVYSQDPGLDLPTGYTIVTTAERLDPNSEGGSEDHGLQKVTVVVSHDGETSFTLVDYKVNR
jgi:type II secretory pathway pseudopilin PulG